MMTDFEVSISNAFKKVFNLNVKLCFFHLTQSIFRKLMSTGLKPFYQKSTDFQKLIKMIFYLALLESDQVESIYYRIKNEALSSKNFETIFSKLNDLFFYLEETYVESNSRYPPKSWNHYKSIHRTNNYSES